MRPMTRLLVCLALGLIAMPSLAQVARAQAPALHRILVKYFADLNAHRFHAAWRLEAPCGITVAVPDGPGTPRLLIFHGRGAWSPPQGVYGEHPIVAAAHVTGIRPLHVHLLDSHHPVAAFAVRGRFRYDHTAFPRASATRRNGFHVVKILMWRCSGRWGVEPKYWESNGLGP